MGKLLAGVDLFVAEHLIDEPINKLVTPVDGRLRPNPSYNIFLMINIG